MLEKEREYQGRERMNKEKENGKWMGLKHVDSKAHEGGREIKKENREGKNRRRNGEQKRETQNGLGLWWPAVMGER